MSKTIKLTVLVQKIKLINLLRVNDSVNITVEYVYACDEFTITRNLALLSSHL